MSRGFKKVPTITKKYNTPVKPRMVLSSKNWEVCKANGWTTPELIIENRIPFVYQ